MVVSVLSAYTSRVDLTLCGSLLLAISIVYVCWTPEPIVTKVPLTVAGGRSLYLSTILASICPVSWSVAGQVDNMVRSVPYLYW